MLLRDEALFRGSIAANLAAFQDDGDPLQVWRALECAGLAEKVRSLPEGVETPVGSRFLTDAHRRALHIARTLLAEPELLVLDQPAHGLDPESRSALLATLRTSCATRVVLARDRELVASADRVLMFSRGRLQPTVRSPQQNSHSPATD